MQPVYFLLRQTQQYGPYNLRELTQFGIEPTDLVWIEGMSRSWCYPFAIEELKEILLRTPVTPESNESHPVIDQEVKATSVFVSLPFKALICQPAKMVTPDMDASSVTNPSENILQNDAWHTNSTLSPFMATSPEVPSALTYITNSDKPAVKNKGKLSLLVVCIIAIVVGSVLFLFLPTKRNHQQIAKAPQLSIAAAIPISTPNAPVAATIPNSTVTKQPHPRQTKRMKAKTGTTQFTLSRRTTVKSNTTLYDIADETPGNELPLDDNTLPSAQAQTENAAIHTEPRKKGVSDYINKIIKKNDGKDNTNPGEQPATIDKTGSRKAVHRGEKQTETIEPNHLADALDILASEPEQAWMMGIRNQTITVRNRNDQTIAEAIVEITYYTEQNQKLQSKNLVFNDILANHAAKQKVPDHALADHIGYRLVSVK